MMHTSVCVCVSFFISTYKQASGEPLGRLRIFERGVAEGSWRWF